MDTDAYGIGFHVALSNHEHGVDFHLFGTLDLAVDFVGAFVDFVISGSKCRTRPRWRLGYLRRAASDFDFSRLSLALTFLKIVEKTSAIISIACFENSPVKAAKA